MSSLWNLGEGFGYKGRELGLNQITCPFCLERGNFKTVHHAEKKKPNASKKLNFDTLECGNCKGYVMVLWSAGANLYDFRVLPRPSRVEKYPEEWPEAVGRFWVQAHRNLDDETWDSAAVMARSALQAAMREQEAKGKNLKEEIDDLADKGLLPPIMQEWAHTLRLLGNDSAHPEAEQPPVEPQDVRDIIQFLNFLLELLYSLPKRISQYRERDET